MFPTLCELDSTSAISQEAWLGLKQSASSLSWSLAHSASARHTQLKRLPHPSPTAVKTGSSLGRGGKQNLKKAVWKLLVVGDIC